MTTDLYYKNVFFIIAGDAGYLDLIEMCVKSIKKFSNIPVIVYGVNCDVGFEYDNVINRRINVSRRKISTKERDTRPFYYKIDASIDALNKDDNKIYIWIDGDCLVNENIDNVLKYVKNIGNYPLCTVYQYDNLIHFNENVAGVKKFHGEELGDVMNITKNNNIVISTGMYMFDIRSKWFLEEVIKHHEYFLENPVDKENYFDDLMFSEERLMNVLFWKYGFKNNLPITWISKDSKNNFNLPTKISKIINYGYDIMFNFDGLDNRLDFDFLDQQRILFYHGQQDVEKVKIFYNDYIEVDKLLIVAHPDDEIIFAGGSILNDIGWKVVVVTKGNGDGNDSDIRKQEFEKVMHRSGVNEFKILGYDDDMYNVVYDVQEVKKDLKKIINEKNWKLILTHNEEGEYGHIIHKSIHNIVKELNPTNLKFFKKDSSKLHKGLLQNKLKLLNLYQSQDTDLGSFREYSHYETLYETDRKKYKERIKYSFNDMLAYVNVKNNMLVDYNVKFIDKNENKVVYEDNIVSNSWCKTIKFDYQINWEIVVEKNKTGDIVFRKILDYDYRKIGFKINSINHEKIKEFNKIINKMINLYKIRVEILVDKDFYNLFDVHNRNIILNDTFGDNYINYILNDDVDLKYVFKKFL